MSKTLALSKKLIAALALSSVLLQGCISFNSLADAKDAKGTGVAKTFTTDKSRVWQTTLSIITASDLKLVDENEDKGLILAQQPISPFSLTAGQNVAIFITDVGGRTRVEVVDKKSVCEIEFVSKDWDDYIIEKLSERLN